MKELFLGLYLAFSVFSLSAQTIYYVDAARPDDSGTGLSWATAKKSIQAAIKLAVSSDAIVVTNGIYAPISITDNRAILIRSLNGADATLIDGGGVNRCAMLGNSSEHTNTVLTGFTLRNGYVTNDNGGGSVYGTLNTCTLFGNTALYGGGSYGGALNNCTFFGNIATNGGGSYSSTLNNCTLSDNIASDSGGGSYEGTLNNCMLSDNIASSAGGGSYHSTLNTCTLSGNTASYSGGGSYYSTLNTCTLSGNTALYGGGSHGGTLNNCTLSGNTASYSGGGSHGGTLNNSTLSGNTAPFGGGSYGASLSKCTLNNCTLFGNTASSAGGGSYRSALRNCTLSGNTASYFGGGSYVGSLTNCIVWGNFVNGTTNNYSAGTFDHSCTLPLPAGGTGNIAADPLFVNAVAMNLRVRGGSPCINTGLNAGVSGGTDLDGNPRIIGGQVDMGCYESPFTNQAVLLVVAVGSKVYGDAPFQLATTGGSGTGAVSYLLVSGPGTVSSSGLVTITGSGEIVVQARKAGDENYNSVTSANLSITVTRSNPTLYIIR